MSRRTLTVTQTLNVCPTLVSHLRLRVCWVTGLVRENERLLDQAAKNQEALGESKRAFQQVQEAYMAAVNESAQLKQVRAAVHLTALWRVVYHGNSGGGWWWLCSGCVNLTLAARALLL